MATKKAVWLVAVFLLLIKVKNAAGFLDERPPPKAAMIFLHGLGNSPKTCIPFIQDRLLLQDPSLCQNVKFVFPSAPRLCSTINGGQCLPCWFDLYDWPVGVSVRDDREGIRQAVRQVEREVAKLEAEGIPKECIFLGGFSQGAALALETVYGSEDRFAGCIALSGWLPLRGHVECSANARETPLFWGHGHFDSSVRAEQQFFGVKKLLEQGVKSTSVKTYKMGHTVSTEELGDIAEFLHLALQKIQEQGRVPLRTKVVAGMDAWSSS